MDVPGDIATKEDWEDVRSLYDTPVPGTVVRAFVMSSRSFLKDAGHELPTKPTEWRGPYTIDDLTDLFLRDRSTIYRWLDAEKLRAKKTAGGWMIDASQIPSK